MSIAREILLAVILGLLRQVYTSGGITMCMVTPDGMGADRYNERQNMKEARHVKEPNYDVIAEDDEGNELYVTESADTKEAARDTAAELNSAQDGFPNVPEEVARFDYRPRSEQPE